MTDAVQALVFDALHKAAEEFLEDTGGMTTPPCVAPDKKERDDEA